MVVSTMLFELGTKKYVPDQMHLKPNPTLETCELHKRGEELQLIIPTCFISVIRTSSFPVTDRRALRALQAHLWAVILAGIYGRKSKGGWELSGWCCHEGGQQDWWAEGAGLVIFPSWPTPSAAPENQPPHFQPQSLGGGGRGLDKLEIHDTSTFLVPSALL